MSLHQDHTDGLTGTTRVLAKLERECPSLTAIIGTRLDSDPVFELVQHIESDDKRIDAAYEDGKDDGYNDGHEAGWNDAREDGEHELEQTQWMVEDILREHGIEPLELSAPDPKENIAKQLRHALVQQDTELGRWQDRIELAIIDAGLEPVDASGNESGDPLDFTADQVRMALGELTDQIADLKEQLARATT